MYMNKSHTFSVEKHQASDLHYDFHLKIDGKKKSWAVPQGPSMDPADKRVAVELDHGPENVQPMFDSLETWDKGTYRAIGASSIAESEKILKQQFRKGRVSIRLNGQKLKGIFSLIKTKGQQWLFFKSDTLRSV